ncbi:hypothetical protein [Legionella sp. WA2022007384]
MAHSTEYLKEIAALVTKALEDYTPTADSQGGQKKIGGPRGFMFKPVAPPRSICLEPMVQGSMGLLMHGIDFAGNGFENPDDIDILVSYGKAAKEALTQLNSKLQSIGSSITLQIPQGFSLVNDIYVIDKSNKNQKLKIQLVDKEDFGLNKIQPIKVNGVPVMPLGEALISLDYRIKIQGARPKDRFAYFTFIEKYSEELLSDTKVRQEAKEFIKNYLTLSPDKRKALAFEQPGKEEEEEQQQPLSVSLKS